MTSVRRWWSGMVYYLSMATMSIGKIISLFIDICMFRAAPQDLPASSNITISALTLSALTGILMLQVTTPLVTSVKMALTDLFFMAALVLLVLHFRGLLPRAWQTLTALGGTGALLTLVAWPLSSWYQGAYAGGADAGLPALLLLSLMVWNIGVIGHILRHALSVGLPIGIGLAIAYAFISINLMRILFPVPA